MMDIRPGNSLTRYLCAGLAVLYICFRFIVPIAGLQAPWLNPQRRQISSNSGDLVLQLEKTPVMIADQQLPTPAIRFSYAPQPRPQPRLGVAASQTTPAIAQTRPLRI